MNINEEGLETIYKKSKNGKKFKFVKVTCEDCKKERFQRIDKWRQRLTNRCLQCNARRLNPDNTKHGFSKSKLYHKWHNMIYRCYDTRNRSFPYYGGRGIGVCLEWLDHETGLEKFCKWALANGFSEETNLQIDRIDNDGDYCPENCAFITRRENLEKMENLFGVKGRVVKKIEPKKQTDKYQNLVQNLKLVEKDLGAPSKDGYVPLWDFLENLGKKKTTLAK